MASSRLYGDRGAISSAERCSARRAAKAAKRNASIGFALIRNRSGDRAERTRGGITRAPNEAACLEDLIGVTDILLVV